MDRLPWLALLILLAGCSTPAADPAATLPEADGVRLPTPAQGGTQADVASPKSVDAAGAVQGALLCGPCNATLTQGVYTWEPSGALNPTDADHYVVAFRASELTIEVHTTFDAGRS